MSVGLGPSNRNEFKDYCLRRLGAPVISLAIDDLQIDDRVDDAIKYFWDHHYNGSERLLVPHLLTEEEIRTKVINVDQKISGISHVFNLNSSYGTTNSGVFGLQYQMVLTNLSSISTLQLNGYVSAMQNIELIDNILSTQVPFRFNKHTDKLYVDADLGTHTSAGNYLLIEAHVILDQDLYNSLWKDSWLQKYATALIKRQWGSNLRLYQNIELLGGVTFDGNKIFDEAQEEIEALETSIKATYTNQIFIG